MKNIVVSTVVMLVFLGAVVAGVILVNQEQDYRNKAASDTAPGHNRVTICHRTESESNPYVAITVPTNSDHFDEHKGHSGDLLFEDETECPGPSPTASSSASPTSSPEVSPSSSASPSPTATPQLGCPLNPSAGDILVDFNTASIRSDGSESSSVSGPFSVSIPQGTYRIKLASSDNHPEQSSQNSESYVIELISDSQVVSTSNAVSDLPDDSTSRVDTVNENLVLSSPVSQVRVRHAAYPSNSTSNSINAECAMFTKVILAINAQCSQVKVFDDQWAVVSAEDFDTLNEGDLIRLTVSGSTSEGIIDKARFVINGNISPEVTQRRSGTNEFYYEYTIPADTEQLSIKGEVHHSTLGWF